MPKSRFGNNVVKIALNAKKSRSRVAIGRKAEEESFHKQIVRSAKKAQTKFIKSVKDQEKLAKREAGRIRDEIEDIVDQNDFDILVARMWNLGSGPINRLDAALLS